MIGREGLHRQVLLDIFSEAGATHPVSYISTGNVSFEVSPDRLEAVVEEVAHEISEVVARPTEVFVRSESDLRSMVASDPYADQPLSVDHGAEVTFFLDAVPPNSTFRSRAPVMTSSSFERANVSCFPSRFVLADSAAAPAA